MEGVLRFKEVSQVIHNLSLKWDERLSTEIERAPHMLGWMNVSVRDIYLHNDDADIRHFVIKNKPDCVEILDTSKVANSLEDSQRTLNKCYEVNPCVKYPSII